MKLLKHLKNTDTAIKVIKTYYDGYALVKFYNINYTKISGEAPLYLGESIIKLDHPKMYTELIFD